MRSREVRGVGCREVRGAESCEIGKVVEEVVITGMGIIRTVELWASACAAMSCICEHLFSSLSCMSLASLFIVASSVWFAVAKASRAVSI